MKRKALYACMLSAIMAVMMTGIAFGGTCTFDDNTQTKQIDLSKEEKSDSIGSSIQARNKLKEIGETLEAAYKWTMTIKYTPDYALNPDLGIRHYANRGFSTKEGDCYDMACCLCEMARALGYEADAMTGFVPLRGGGISPHCWCEININGTRYIFDPDFEVESKKSGYMIYYGKNGTWRYQNYEKMHN